MVSASPPRKQRLVVVGAGMAAFGFLNRLAKNGDADRYDVTLLGEEPRPCYDRVNLTECFSGKAPDDLLLAPADWYEAEGFSLHTATRVAEIDRSARVVRTEGGESFEYGQLVLATGSRPFVPPIDGVDLPGVFVYRTIEDIDRIKAHAAGCRRVAVLGGGLLGLEAAKAIHDLGCEAHVLEVAPRLMPRQLNADASDLLRQEVEDLGVAVHLQRRAERIEAADDGLIVHFSGHDPLAAEMVVISAGIRPNDELAHEAGLTLGPRGGIAVNNELVTSDPQVHAIGECVSLDGVQFGLVGPCYDMADTLAANLTAQAAGEPREAKFYGASRASRLKLMGVDVSTLGVPIGEAEAGSIVTANGDGFSRSLIVSKRRRIVGALAVGEWPERERLSGVIADRGRVSSRQLRRFKESGLIWGDTEGDTVLDWPASATVCSCLNVTRGELTDALQAGATDAAALAEATGASTVCGSCRNLLCDLAGDREAAVGPKGRLRLLTASVLAVALIPFLVAASPPAVESVQTAWRDIDLFWRDETVKQVTGYSLLGVSLLASTLSLRKRVSWIKLGDFGSWRGLHGIVGTLTLIGFLVHTSTRLGHNFTLALAVTFLLLNLLGAFTGIAAALESRFTGEWGRRLRAWRPRLTQAHIWLLWPLPALIAFHIVAVYYY